MNGKIDLHSQMPIDGEIENCNLRKNAGSGIFHNTLCIPSNSANSLKRGSITVEASIVVATILIIIFAAIYGCLLAFHQSHLNSLVTKAAQRGACAWVDSRIDIESGRINYEAEKDPLYSEIFYDGSLSYSEVINEFSTEYESIHFDNLQQKKINSIRQLILNDISKSILKPISSNLEITFTNSFLNRKIEVCITQDIQLPLGFLKKIFSGSDTLRMRAEGTAVISVPTKYIRNIDLAVEYLNRIDEQLKIGAKINELKEKLVQIFK